ncbi:MAG: hypothetical protein OXG24_03705 [Gammaproteobacteria bacterium]|nr:hypothetical protein [Gammaproteobacteria bacterium]
MRCSVFCRSVCTVAVFAFVYGCAGINYEIPPSFDLTGSWSLDEDLSDVAPDLTKIRKSEQRDAIAGRRADPTDSSTFIVHDFPVVSSNTMRIEQDAESMGIQFEDAPYVDFKWGRQMRNGWRIEVGWNGDSLVVTKMRDSVRGSETYTLNSAGNILTVKVRVITSADRIVLDRIYTRDS